MHVENMTGEPIEYLVLGPPLDEEEEELENETAEDLK